ncbi:MAG: hypothetical protein Q9198_000358 [Flavoplaca austrocitrina]
MLQWLIYSREPLRISELAEVVAISIKGDKVVDPEARFTEPTEIFSILSNLFSGKYEGPGPYEPLRDLSQSQGPVYDPLHFAAWLGFPKLVLVWLDESHNINSTSTYDGESVLSSAIKGHADEELIRIVLAEGSDVNARMEQTPFATALQLAVSRRHKPAIRLLLQNGVDVNAQGHRFGSPGGPALFAACLDKHTGIARLLLEHGADVNGNGQIGTPLMAALFNHGDAEELIELLLEYGANVHAATKGAGTALELAISEHPEAVVDRLLKAGADPNLTPEGHNSLISTVIATSNVAYVEKLLKYGANISGSESAALYLACRSGSLDMVQLLLDSGANVDAQGGPLGTALHAACFDNHGSAVRLLLQRGANINTSNGKYETALQAAAASQDPSEQVIDVLLDAGADVNFQGGKYNTALQAAACGGDSLPRRKEQHLRIVQRLLSKGANVNLIGGRYGTALRAAARCTWFELADILLKHGAHVSAQDLEFAESCGGISKKTLALFQDAYVSQSRAVTD